MRRFLQLVLILSLPIAAFWAMIGLDRQFGQPAPGYDYVVRLDLPRPEAKADLPQIDGPQDARRPLVVIDPGHGGHDPGAGPGALKEKAVTLSIARELRAQLLAAGGIRVAMTRMDDRYFTLGERSAMARRLGADLFVSIHADSAETDQARGASIYVLSEKGSSQAAAKFAARENAADEVNGITLAETGDQVSAILLDLSQRDAQAGSEEMARLFLREAGGKLRFHNATVQSAALGVLKAPDIPSVLIETGYVNNPQDAEWLTSEEGRLLIAQITTDAIRAFFARRVRT